MNYLLIICLLSIYHLFILYYQAIIYYFIFILNIQLFVCISDCTRSYLWPMGSLVAAGELLAATGGI